MIKHTIEKYRPSSAKNLASPRVICCALNNPQDLLQSGKKNNPVLKALHKGEMNNCAGLYFYKFRDASKPFIKIGETTRPGGIAGRFTGGWHRNGTDSYLSKIENKKKVDSEFFKAILLISPDNPAYFVFYEHPLVCSHTKADEMYSMVAHNRYFKKGTINSERINGNRLLGRKLVFHKSAFSEVLKEKFPSGHNYL